MVVNLLHNKIVADTISERFKDSVNESLVPMLASKYGDALSEIVMYEDYLCDGFTLDGVTYYPLTAVIDGTPTTVWVKWDVSNKKNFANDVSFAYTGDETLEFSFADDVPADFYNKLTGRKIIAPSGSMSLKVYVASANALVLKGKYSQSFVDEMARQLTKRIESAMDVAGMADSGVELHLVFAPGTYFEHVSENVTYRRLLITQKGCQARDFWIKWTRLDGDEPYTISDSVNEDDILFELGEDVPRKLREKEYRFLCNSNPDKYQYAMGKKTVTEWRDLIKRAIKRGDVEKVAGVTKIAEHSAELSDKLHAILDSYADVMPKREPVKTEADKSYDDLLKMARAALGMTDTTPAEAEAEPVAEDNAEFTLALDSDENVELALTLDSGDDAEFEFTLDESVEFNIDAEAPALDAEEAETEQADQTATEETIEEIEEEVIEQPEAEEELTEEPIEETEAEEELTEEPIEEPEAEEELTEEPIEEPEAEEELTEEPIEETETEEVEEEEKTAANDTVDLFDLGTESESEADSTEEEKEPAYAVASDIFSEAYSDDVTKLTDALEDSMEEARELEGLRLESIRDEIEAKVKLQYEAAARMKAEAEALQLKIETQRLMVENARLVREAELAESKRMKEEQDRLATEARMNAAVKQRQAEEAKLREQLEQQMKQEMRERERVAESARLALEEQRKLEEERLRERELALQLEAERLKREEQERIEAERAREAQRIKADMQRRAEEEAERARRAAIAAMPPKMISKRAEIIFKFGTDSNIIKVIKTIVEKTLVAKNKQTVPIKIKAYLTTNSNVNLDVTLPESEAPILVDIIKAIGGGGLGVTKVKLEDM